MPDIQVKCDVCFEIIALADIDKLVQPISGAMFMSPDTLHGFPDPFHPDLDWEHMRCPYCRTRPFMVDFEVLTPNGVYSIPEATKQEGTGSMISVEAVESPNPWNIAEQERKARSQDDRKQHTKRRN